MLLMTMTATVTVNMPFIMTMNDYESRMRIWMLLSRAEPNRNEPNNYRGLGIKVNRNEERNEDEEDTDKALSCTLEDEGM